MDKTSEEFLDEVLSVLISDVEVTRTRIELGSIKPAEAHEENKRAKGTIQQAILQHFQQEQERNPEIERFHKKVDELIELYGGDIVVMSQKDWDRNLSNNYVLKSEVDRLIREARIEEINNLPLEGLIDQCFIAFRKRLDNRLKEIKGDR